MGRLSRGSFVLTCEHASRRLFANVGTLGLSKSLRTSHIAGDKGAAALTRALAARLRRPAVLGQYSRLVADLNRGSHHPRVVPKVAFGHPVPGNAILSAAERAQRIATYRAPWRADAFRMIKRAVGGAAGCVHLSIHSFTPKLHGTMRGADVGLLYEASPTRDRRLAAELKGLLEASGFAVRRNYAYRGISDGFTTWCRRRLPGTRYIGIEIELNQRLVGQPGVQHRMVDAVAEAFDSGR